MSKQSRRSAEKRVENERAAMQMRQQVPPKQVVYPSVASVAVQAQPDGIRVLTFTTPFEQVVFPMTADAAEAIGKALSAPSVVVPGTGDGAPLL